MEYYRNGNNIIVENLNDFSLQQTLECGQCFRWEKISDNKYLFIAFSKILEIEQTKSSLIFYNTDIYDFETIWINYFDLLTDYSLIKKELIKINNVMADIIDYSYGIRILKQDKWEALCSYILSQNNNIPRIMKIINSLCINFGEEISDGLYDFPSFKKIASLDINDLSIIKAGFRDKYIYDAATKLSRGEINLELISNLNSFDAENELVKIKGVGPKVAKCTLLYGFNKLDCYPVDVWMKRANEDLFKNFDIKEFGNYSGIAQQYIFYYYRSKN